MSDRKVAIFFVELLLRRRYELLRELEQIEEKILFLSKVYDLTIDFDASRVVLEG